MRWCERWLLAHDVLQDRDSIDTLPLCQYQTPLAILAHGFALLTLQQLLHVPGSVVELVLTEGQFNKFRQTRLRLEGDVLLIGGDRVIELLCGNNIEIPESEPRQGVFGRQLYGLLIRRLSLFEA